MKRGLIWCLVLFLLLPGLASALSSSSSGQEVQALQQRLKDLDLLTGRDLRGENRRGRIGSPAAAGAGGLQRV